MQDVLKKTMVFGCLWLAMSADAAVSPAPMNEAPAGMSAVENVNPIALNEIPPLPAPTSDNITLAAANMATTTTTTTTKAPAAAADDAIPEQPSIMAPLPPLPGAVQQRSSNAPQRSAAPPLGSAQSMVFQDILKQQFPLSNEQIQALHRKYKDVQRVIAAPAFSPKPTVSAKVVVLSPGSIPPVIRLASGYVSSIVFMDQTGAPWPILAYDVGDPGSFNIAWDKYNVMMIQGSRPYATGNMAVRLAGLPTPVMLTLVNDQKVVDYRLDFRVQGLGPNAKPSSAGDSVPPEANSLLLNLLQGVAPIGSQPLGVTGGQAQAWMYNGRLLLRTSYTVLSPGWTATMSSADGTKVYEMGKSPLILVTDNGRIISLKVEGL